MEKIRVLYKKVGECPELLEVPNELESFQQLVGGYIETVPLFPSVLAICDEEGKLKGKPFNFKIRGEDIVGSVVCVGYTDGEENFRSLTNPEIIESVYRMEGWGL